jgi:hypothetical protein
MFRKTSLYEKSTFSNIHNQTTSLHIYAYCYVIHDLDYLFHSVNTACNTLLHYIKRLNYSTSNWSSSDQLFWYKYFDIKSIAEVVFVQFLRVCIFTSSCVIISICQIRHGGHVNKQECRILLSAYYVLYQELTLK